MCVLSFTRVVVYVYSIVVIVVVVVVFFLFQAEDGIRDLVRSRGLGDVYKRQLIMPSISFFESEAQFFSVSDTTSSVRNCHNLEGNPNCCLLYTSDAADERSSVDLGGRRIIKKKNNVYVGACRCIR